MYIFSMYWSPYAYGDHPDTFAKINLFHHFNHNFFLFNRAYRGNIIYSKILIKNVFYNSIGYLSLASIKKF